MGKAYEPATMERDKKADSVVECPVKKEPAHDGMKKPVDSGRKDKSMDDCPPRTDKAMDDHAPRKEKATDDCPPRKEKVADDCPRKEKDECPPRKEKVADDCPRKEKAMDDHAPRKEAKDASPPKEKDAADGKMVPPDDEPPAKTAKDHSQPHEDGDAPVSGFLASLGGAAYAEGEDTFTQGDLNLNIRDNDHVTIARGKVEMTAGATGEGADADAVTWAEVEGADFVFMFTVNRSGSGDDADFDSSTLKLLAIDFKHFDRPGGPLVIDRTVDLTGSAPGMSLSGNLAHVSAFGSMDGEDVFGQGMTTALAGPGFSFVDGFLFGGVA